MSAGSSSMFHLRGHRQALHLALDLPLGRPALSAELFASAPSGEELG